MLVLPASVIYLFKKSRKQAILGTVVGTLIMTAFGSCFNAIYLLPKFSELYGIPLDAIIGMGTAINPAIHSISGLVLMCVVPLNLLKGGLVSLITILVYKKIPITWLQSSCRNPHKFSPRTAEANPSAVLFSKKSAPCPPGSDFFGKI